MRLQDKIKRWNKECFGNINVALKELFEKIDDMDRKGELENLTLQEIQLREGALKDFQALARKHQLILCQKCQSTWFEGGRYKFKILPYFDEKQEEV